jgi:acylphosphatase
MTSFAHVFFSGHVQGVGFRYETLRVAHGYEVAGYVRNLPDGRVELEIEGDEVEIDAFVKAVKKHMDGFINKVETSKGTREAAMQGFEIK